MSSSSGAVTYVEDRQLSRVVSQDSNEDGISMPSLTLQDLLDGCEAPGHVDYLAMDIEGSEYDVLSVYPFGERQILSISTEGDAAATLLVSNGYVRVSNRFNTTAPWENYFVHESIVDTTSCRRL